MLMKRTNDKRQEMQREKTIYENKRWEQFRNNKHVILDEYFKRKRNQRRAEGYIRLMFLRRMIYVVS
jgi:hypothetical protein